MSARLERVSNLVVTVCALLVAAVFVRRQLFAPAPTRAAPRPPTYVENWTALATGGSRVGPAGAAVQIVEFGDFQCPFCKRFHESVLAIMSDAPGVTSLAYRHFPLPYHEYAVPAARAAECAGEQGRFEEMATALLAFQDSIGIRPWAAFADAAGVGNRARFTTCLEDGSTDQRLAADRDAASQLGVNGTPTVLINGWRLPAGPSLDSLRWLVGEFAAGRVPFRRRD